MIAEMPKKRAIHKVTDTLFFKTVISTGLSFTIKTTERKANTMTQSATGQSPSMSWDASLYQQKHHYVYEKGLDVLALLAAKPDERILDLGCGTGQLTAKLAESGATVIGVDSSPAMLEAATANYSHITFECLDAAKLTYQTEFDAVFSNAALHWMRENPQAVINGVYAALKPGGRFVLEMGAKRNVQKVVDGIAHGLRAIGLSDKQIQQRNPWYFPSLGEYTTHLESVGFEIDYAVTFDRPSPQDNPEQGLRHWLMMFGKNFYQHLSDEQLETALQETEKYLKPLIYQNNQWVADYRRLRVAAHKPNL
jgi:trans-aconitate methyltransferase